MNAIVLLFLVGVMLLAGEVFVPGAVLGILGALAMAVRIPCMIATGVGGHPGTATSTGITFDTRPQLA